MSDKPVEHDLNDEPIDDEIADVLEHAKFPANKDALVEAARAAGVSNDVITLFDGLPEQDYADADSVEQLLGSNGGPGISV